MSNQANIKFVSGTVAPRYDRAFEAKLQEVVVTERGTTGGLPIVDFVMTGPDGTRYVMTLTGRIINGIASAVKGVNLRNHGVAEP